MYRGLLGGLMRDQRVALGFALALGACGLPLPDPSAFPGEAGVRYTSTATYLMGSLAGVHVPANEQPQHQATLSPFALDGKEVTVAQYSAFYDQLSSAQKCDTANDSGSFVCGQPRNDPANDCNWAVAGRGQHPVNCVDWFQAGAYCAWARPDGRLPTEAEWEYAARDGGKTQDYPWGDDAWCPNAVCHCGGDKDATSTAVVCSTRAGNTSAGACDLAGNVWEWCSDWYDAYTAAAQTNPHGPGQSPSGSRVLRGGGWHDLDLGLRASGRLNADPTVRSNAVGFRCAWPL